jgi:hypothetical protein
MYVRYDLLICLCGDCGYALPSSHSQQELIIITLARYNCFIIAST